MDAGIVATHIPPALGYGGVPTTVGVLTRAWAKSGRTLTVVASDESLGRRLQPDDAQLGPKVEVRLYRSYGFRRWGFGLGAIPELYRLCREAPVVYIHGVATWPCTLAAALCGLLRRPFVVAPHGGLMPEHMALIRRRKPHKWLYYKLLTFPTLRRASAIHCTSATEIQGVREALGGEPPVLMVPNGIESGDYAVADRPDGSGTTLCFLGHIQREKGINAFIRVWLETRGPHDRLIVAGRGVDGVYFEEFLRLVEESQGAVIYRGYLDRGEVRETLARSHFLVLPSGLEQSGGMRENFGNVVAEAMASGRPVLVARGLAWDHLEFQGAGLVFEREAGSVRAVLERLRTLDPADWERMSRTARKYVERNLDPVALGERVWRVLQGHGESLPGREACCHE